MCSLSQWLVGDGACWMLPSLLVRLGTRTPLLGRKVTICFIQRCWIEVGRSQSYHKNSVSVWMYFANKPIYIYIYIHISFMYRLLSQRCFSDFNICLFHCILMHLAKFEGYYYMAYILYFTLQCKRCAT